MPLMILVAVEPEFIRPAFSPTTFRGRHDAFVNAGRNPRFFAGIACGGGGVLTIAHPRDLPYLGSFFYLTAPQAFFRPDRRFPMLPRAEAVKAGRHCAIAAHFSVSRPRLDCFKHGSRLDERGLQVTSYINCRDWVSFGFPSRGIDVAARSTVLYAVQRCWPHHGLQGFDAAMSRTHSTRDRRRKNRAVVEARPSRDSIPPRDAAKV